MARELDGGSAPKSSNSAARASIAILRSSKEIANSGSFAKAMELHADHARSTMHEYFTKAGKLAELSTRAVLDGLLAWQPATHRTTANAETAN